MGKIDIDIGRYIALGVPGIRAILDDLEDGQISAAEAEEHLIVLVANFVDELVPTGPFDVLDDQPIEDGIRFAFEKAKDLLDRDSAELRKRADGLAIRIAKAEAKGRKRVGPFGLLSVEAATAKVAELRAAAELLDEAEGPEAPTEG